MRLVKITCFLYHPEDSVDIYAGWSCAERTISIIFAVSKPSKQKDLWELSR